MILYNEPINHPSERGIFAAGGVYRTSLLRLKNRSIYSYKVKSTAPGPFPTEVEL